MPTDVDVLVKVPCFKCLIWEPIRESHLYCNPRECEKLTEWLMKEAEKCQAPEQGQIFVALPETNDKTRKTAKTRPR